MAKGMVRVPVREQDPKVRATNFEEVCLGSVSYTHLDVYKRQWYSLYLW